MNRDTQEHQESSNLTHDPRQVILSLWISTDEHQAEKRDSLVCSNANLCSHFPLIDRFQMMTAAAITMGKRTSSPAIKETTDPVCRPQPIVYLTLTWQQVAWFEKEPTYSAPASSCLGRSGNQQVADKWKASKQIWGTLIRYGFEQLI